MKTNKTAQSALFFSLTWEFLNEYLPKQAGHSHDTVESYRDSLTLFRRFLTNEQQKSLAKFKFSDCTKDCIYDFREYLRQRDNKSSTVNVRVTAIRSYLNYASDMDISVQSIALAISRIKPCKKIKKEFEILSEDALAAVLSAPPQTKMGLRDRTLLVTMYDSAVRLSELLGIKLGDITLAGEYPCIFIHGKGNKERTVQITEKSVGHLKEYIRVFHANSSLGTFLFSTTIKGKSDKMSSGNVQRLLKRYADIAREICSDMPRSVHPHMLRRTRASNLYQDGVAIELVSTVLGHAKVETTKAHYAQPSVAKLRDALESVPTPIQDEEPLWVGNEERMAQRCGLR
jgi:site-specific recombinase XerD